MCGIVGYTGKSQAVPFLLDGLKALEYRGYDSAGIEILTRNKELCGIKCSGRVANLEDKCREYDTQSCCGIAHTRWATHGAPNDRNAHPHTDCTGNIAIVHNGIIENFKELREELLGRGHEFASETDSEVIAHIIEECMPKTNNNLLDALRMATEKLEGSWAIVAISSYEPDVLCCARKGSPLVLAQTDGGAYAASDITALAGVSKDVIQLDDDQFARMTQDGNIDVFDSAGNCVAQPAHLQIDWDISAATTGNYPDFMAKEIAEQPDVIERLLRNRLTDQGIVLDELDMDDEEISQLDRIYIVACGTSYHVGLIAKNLIEQWAKIPVIVETASEFNYQPTLVSEHTLCVIITQSGETADTLAAARKMHRLGARVFAITNVLGSTAAREADGVLYVQAGPEVSVCSTKAYTAQIIASILLTLVLAQKNGQMAYGEVARRFRELCKIPDLIRVVLDRSWQAETVASYFAQASSALFLGRNYNATTAAEGALKLKEISYLHAEAYPAGEMKHGPIALLEKDFPVVVIVPEDHVHDKTVSNIQEVIARGATCIAVATDGDQKVASMCGDRVLWIPKAPEYFAPILAIVHLQQLARFVALSRGCDIDKPRNLAKSVTVE